jgi:hypothetical protein
LKFNQNSFLIDPNVRSIIAICRVVARRATTLQKWWFFVGVGAAHPHEKPLVELT